MTQSPITRHCTYCGARPGEVCVNGWGLSLGNAAHANRMDAATLSEESPEKIAEAEQARATPGPWYPGPLPPGNEDDDRSVSVGPYDLTERPGGVDHYEDTLLEVWYNPNLHTDDDETVCNAQLLVLLRNSLPEILAALTASPGPDG